MKPKPRPLVDLASLRSSGTQLLVAAGLKPDRASALAAMLLWHDSVGMVDQGISALPDLLARIETGAIDPAAEPTIGPERAALAILNGNEGPPLLTLARASEVAYEKAREYGSGLVRVKGIGELTSAASVMFEIAIGPAIGIGVGPRGAWAVGLPSANGLPYIADACLGSDASSLSRFSPWSPMIEPGEWLIQAIAFPAWEPLANFHERLSTGTQNAPATDLLPMRLEALLRDARENGVGVSKATDSALKSWGKKLGITP